MPSFDIVSRTEIPEVDNAVQGAMREIGTRFDFKGSKSSIERNDGRLLIRADDELKLKQVQELLRGSKGKQALSLCARTPCALARPACFASRDGQPAQGPAVPFSGRRGSGIAASLGRSPPVW